jgi:electron transfer flavoprotein alpha/beta subunit
MGAKKKEVKSVLRSEISTESSAQSMDRIFIPTNSKQTEVIDGEVDQSVGRIIEILKSEIKVI